MSNSPGNRVIRLKGDQRGIGLAASYPADDPQDDLWLPGVGDYVERPRRLARTVGTATSVHRLDSLLEDRPTSQRSTV